jgi:hypothetical protein
VAFSSVCFFVETEQYQEIIRAVLRYHVADQRLVLVELASPSAKVVTVKIGVYADSIASSISLLVSNVC